ncbi:hypothetical protein [Bordetella sp. BOR01]|uniref:hypothetical protein n=1 Tax=Bordetella sp. BOR01 TaxID=2854779 RepID=UPI001C477B7C|nr:hypothetical protein [Bordetella sp. BOR01]MBV7482546.1 hypothetical protein [Bordetella sp. BOR01]
MAVCLAACAAVCGAAAYPGGVPPLGGLALPPGSTQASLGQDMRLYGIPADIRLVEIPMPVAQAVQALSAQYPLLSDLGVYPGLAMLSGQAMGDSWVVALEPAGPRLTRGTVSVLRPGAGAVGGEVTHARNRPSWLPAEARLHLDFSGRGQAGLTTHQVWTLALPVAQARQATIDGLRRDGWRPDAGVDDSGRWVRGGTRLDIVITAVQGGSGILLQRHDEATP